MNEKYNNDSIIFLQELFEQEDAKSRVLKRKKEISHSSEYNKELSYHEWRKKLIKYLIVSTRSFNRIMTSSTDQENRMADKDAGRREAYMELVHDHVISLEEAASRLNVSKEELK